MNGSVFFCFFFFHNAKWATNVQPGWSKLLKISTLRIQPRRIVRFLLSSCQPSVVDNQDPDARAVASPPPPPPRSSPGPSPTVSLGPPLASSRTLPEYRLSFRYSRRFGAGKQGEPKGKKKRERKNKQPPPTTMASAARRGILIPRTTTSSLLARTHGLARTRLANPSLVARTALQMRTVASVRDLMRETKTRGDREMMKGDTKSPTPSAEMGAFTDQMRNRMLLPGKSLSPHLHSLSPSFRCPSLFRALPATMRRNHATRPRCRILYSRCLFCSFPPPTTRNEQKI